MAREFIEKFELAIRIALLIFSLSVGMVVILAGARSAFAATLRGETIISGDYLKLGDIFDGVKNAEYVLGPAPQPGKDMILNARTLYKIASALDVEWQPATSAEQIILRREATIIPQSEVTNVMEKKLKDTGVDGKFIVRITSNLADIVLPSSEAATMDITAFNFDPQKDIFNAVIVAPSADNPLRRVNISGKVERTIAVPVMKNSLKNGDIIGSLDIDYIDLPQEKIVSGTLLNESELVNMTPRRVLHAGKPVSLADLERPTMVDRGDSVTLIFENGPMVLTVKGKAMQAGSMGDTVRVANTDSNKNLQGIVTAHREVTIR